MEKILFFINAPRGRARAAQGAARERGRGLFFFFSLYGRPVNRGRPASACMTFGHADGAPDKRSPSRGAPIGIIEEKEMTQSSRVHDWFFARLGKARSAPDDPDGLERAQNRTSPPHTPTPSSLSHTPTTSSPPPPTPQPLEPAAAHHRQGPRRFSTHHPEAAPVRHVTETEPAASRFSRARRAPSASRALPARRPFRRTRRLREVPDQFCGCLGTSNDRIGIRPKNGSRSRPEVW